MAAEFGGNGVFLGELEGTKATKGTQKAPGTARISGGAAVKTGLEELYSGCFSRWARTAPGGPRGGLRRLLRLRRILLLEDL